MKYRFLPYLLLFSTVIWAQPPAVGKKYPSVFWEITGNHLKKPSYLFGTMHISSKLAFHLSDSFYVAIKNVDKVALELSPDDWQKDMYDYRTKRQGYNNYKATNRSNSSLSVLETTFKLKDFEKEIIDLLGYEPSTVNNLLYRERQGQTDFEEDTYLDLYIYQTGRKLGKEGLGVEDYLESARLEEEGRVLQEKEKSKDRKSRVNTGSFYEELSDAYRKGDLDKLDSLEQLQMTSPAYWEKFLYERNVVQADNIDKILKNNSLFVGVGSAHLPGDRGVIELLRKKGYTLRPIFMKERDAEHKKVIDKIKVPVSFKKHSIFDGQISCQTPGTLYELDAYLNEKKYLYSDMANGCYYLATQFSTRSSLLHMSEKELMEEVDRYLYEGIPGDIVEKKVIREEGYKGFYIKNKTKKGDYQRYKILFTPFDIFMFKIAGKQDYVNGQEGDTFINSIHISSLYAPLKKTFEPPKGGYSIDVKFQPLVFQDAYTGKSSLMYADTLAKLYTIVDHHYSFNGDYLSDTAFLLLCEESFNRSLHFEKVLDKKITKTAQGYVLDILDSCKNNTYRSAKFVLSWPHIYALTSVGSLEALKHNYVHDSFQIKEYAVGTPTVFVDSIAQFKVSTTSPINLDHGFVKVRQALEKLGYDEHHIPGIKNEYNAHELKDHLSGNSVGLYIENLSKYYYASSPYYGIDTLRFTKGNNMPMTLVASGRLPKGEQYFYYTYSYKGSLIKAHIKYVIGSGRIYVLKTYGLQGQELPAFSKSIFDSFEPIIVQKNEINPFVRNNAPFWKDYFVAKDKKIKTYHETLKKIVFYEQDLDLLYKAYKHISVKEEKYFDYKSDVLSEISTLGSYLGNVDFQPKNYVYDAPRLPNSKTTYEDGENYILEKKPDTKFNRVMPSDNVQKQKLNLLVRLYKEAGDTLNLQRSILEAISNLKTKEAFAYVKNVLLDDPLITNNKYGESMANIFNPMNDTLVLAKTLFPDIMQLGNISEEYKAEIIDLIEDLVRNEKIKAKELKKIDAVMLEANLQFKRQRLNDEKVIFAKNAGKEDPYASANNDKFKLNASLADMIGPIAYLYKEDERATRLVEKMLKSPNKVMVSELVAELLFKNKPVADSIIQNLAKDPYYSYTFYDKLRVRKLQAKFPHALVSQRIMTETMLKNDFNTYDTLVFLEKKLVNTSGRSGYVYVYKYRIKRLDDWKLTVVGLQPQDLSKVNISEYFNEVYHKPLKDDSQVKTYVAEILRKKEITTIKSNFYNDKDSRYGNATRGFNNHDD